MYCDKSAGSRETSREVLSGRQVLNCDLNMITPSKLLKVHRAQGNGIRFPFRKNMTPPWTFDKNLMLTQAVRVTILNKAHFKMLIRHSWAWKAESLMS